MSLPEECRDVDYNIGLALAGFSDEYVNLWGQGIQEIYARLDCITANHMLRCVAAFDNTPELNLTREEWNAVRLAIMTHDMGKDPQETSYTELFSREEQIRFNQRHIQRGVEMAQLMGFPAMTIWLIRNHHQNRAELPLDTPEKLRYSLMLLQGYDTFDARMDKNRKYVGERYDDPEPHTYTGAMAVVRRVVDEKFPSIPRLPAYDSRRSSPRGESIRE